MKRKDQAPPSLCGIVEPLLAWYEQEKRPLPWRSSPTPYHVWLSEIMLQQTRIEAVIPYYERFIAELPDLKSLATVDDGRLMKLWEGLGYYSRARNLKKAALCIMSEHGGVIPDRFEELLRLPGIGPYTAGAIASIAFGLPEPAVDGNVMRVVTRLTADTSDVMQPSTRSRITQDLKSIYPNIPAQASAMTQALMELGERVCLPNGAPRCDGCPLGAACLARQKGLTDTIPYRAPKKPRRIEQKTVLLLFYRGRVAICQRPEQGLLASLWEFPNFQTPPDGAQTKDTLASYGIGADTVLPTEDATHIFTHVEWHMKGYFVRCSEQIKHWQGRPLTFVTPKELSELYALPTAFRAFARALDTSEAQALLS